MPNYKVITKLAVDSFEKALRVRNAITGWKYKRCFTDLSFYEKKMNLNQEQNVGLLQRSWGKMPCSRRKRKSHSGAQCSSVFIVHMVQPAPASKLSSWARKKLVRNCLYSAANVEKSEL